MAYGLHHDISGEYCMMMILQRMYYTEFLWHKNSVAWGTFTLFLQDLYVLRFLVELRPSL